MYTEGTVYLNKFITTLYRYLGFDFPFRQLPGHWEHQRLARHQEVLTLSKETTLTKHRMQALSIVTIL